MHDDQHIARLFLFHRSLFEGQIYPRWVDQLGFGFGYPLFNFYPPLIYIVAELFVAIGFGFVGSIKAMLIVGFIIGALGVYLYTNLYTDKKWALVSSLAFTTFSYRAITVYVRGAFAEFFGLSIFPFVLWTMVRLLRKQTLQNSVLFAVFFGLLILAHPLIAFPALLYLGIYVLWLLYCSKDRFNYLLYQTLAGILGLGLSAFFWLPSLLEKKYTLVGDILTSELADFHIHFVYPSQLWFSPWGFGGSGAGYGDGMSFQIPKVFLILLLAGLAISLYRLLKNFKNREEQGRGGQLLFHVLLLAISIFMMLDVSLPVWNTISFLAFLQFPWRFFAFVTFFLSVAIGIGFNNLNTKSQTPLIFVLLMASCLIIFKQLPYFKPSSYLAVSDNQRTSEEEIMWRISRSSFEFAPAGIVLKKSEYGNSIIDIEKEDLPSSQAEVVAGNANITVAKNISYKKVVEIQAEESSTIRFNTFSFPGWNAYVDGKKISYTSSDKYKRISVKVPAGNHTLELKFEDTGVRKFANILSIASFWAIIALFFLKQVQKNL